MKICDPSIIQKKLFKVMLLPQYSNPWWQFLIDR